MTINFKNFPYSLFLALLLLNLSPAIYDIFRLNFLNTHTIEGYQISEHIEWFDLFQKGILTIFTVPLYFILSKYLKSNNFFTVFKSILLFAVICYGVFFGIINYTLPSTLNAIPIESNAESLLLYLHMESINFYLQFISNVLLIYFIVIGKSYVFYIFFAIKIVGLLISDQFLIPIFGVNGIAYSNFLFTSVSCIVAYTLMNSTINKNHKSKARNFSWFKDFLVIGSPAAFQIIISNFAFLFIVTSTISTLSTEEYYWSAISFFWGIFLVPMLTLGEIIKRSASSAKNPSFFYIPTALITCLILSTIFFWEVLLNIGYGFNTKQSYIIISIILKSLPFYIIYYFGYVAESYLIGIGKTYFPLVSSIIVNFIYYPLAWLSVKNNIFSVDLDFVIYMFGIGIAIQYFFSTIFFIIFRINNH